MYARIPDVNRLLEVPFCSIDTIDCIPTTISRVASDEQENDRLFGVKSD